MIEFVMSRVWLIIAGLAVVAVVLATFAGLDAGTRDRGAADGANALADLMEGLRTSGQVGEVQVDGRDLLFDDGHSLRVCNGSIWVKAGSKERAVEGPQDILLVEGNRCVDVLTIQRSDRLILRSWPRAARSGFSWKRWMPPARSRRRTACIPPRCYRYRTRRGRTRRSSGT
jgi:hypothetical protein